MSQARGLQTHLLPPRRRETTKETDVWNPESHPGRCVGSTETFPPPVQEREGEGRQRQRSREMDSGNETPINSLAL